MDFRGKRVSGIQLSTKLGRTKLGRKATIAALLVAAAASTPAYATDTVANWGGSASGNWSVAGNWTTSDSATLPPNSSTTDAVITSSNSTVALDGGFTVGALTLGSTDILNFNNNTDLTVSGTITNAGQININSAGNTTQLIIGAANVNLTGGGTVTLSDNANNEIFGSVITNTLTNVNNLIQGAGNIGLGDLVLNNQGTINANATTNALIIEANGATNTGILEATTTLDLDANTITNTGGTIKALNGGNVNLESGVTIVGGTLTTVGTGVIHCFNTATLDGSTSAITNSGTFQMDNNTAVTAKGSIINTGIIHFNSTGNQTELVIGASSGGASVTNVSLSGGGNVTMTDNANNLIEGAAAANVFTNVDNTISGAGNIGGNQMALNNQGTINATGTTILYIQTSNGTTNTGLLEATTLLYLDGDTIHNTGGTIEALNGGSVYLQNGVTIDGGSLTSAGTGVIHTYNYGTLDGSTNAITNSGTFQLDNNTTTTAKGSIINTGTIHFASVGNQTELVIGASSGAASVTNVSLSGGGNVTMTDNSGNLIEGAAAANVFTNVDNTISGAGNIGGGQMALDNQGTIDATGATILYIQTSNGTTNTGLIEATTSLHLNGDTFHNTGGTIEALTGGTVYLQNNATIDGGTLTTAGTGVIHIFNTGTLDGSTNTVTNSGNFQIDNNTAVKLLGTIANNGNIQFASVGNSTDMQISGTVNIQGTGTLTMSDNADNRIYGYADSPTSNDTLNIKEPIQGAGQVGLGVTILNNQSTINANAAVNHLVVVAGGTTIATSTNTGTMEASGGAVTGSVLELAGTWDNTSGNIAALNGAGAGGKVLLDNLSVIENGTLTPTGNGTISPNAGTATLENLTITGTGSVSIPNNTALTLIGTITNNGSITINSVGNDTDMSISGDTTLKGTGIVTMSNNTHNRIYALVGTQTLTLQQEIQGAGQIGVAQLILANQSTINANDSTALLVYVAGTTSTNTGTMEASTGGTLQLQGTFDNTSGLITALNGGTVLLNGASISNGTLNATGTGVIEPNSAVGNSATLTNVTLTGTGSYTVINNSITTMIGTITNNSTINLSSGGNFTDIEFNGDATLKGTGIVTMGNNINNRIYENGHTLTLQQEIQGAGQIGVGQTILVNQSTINANDSTALVVFVSGTTSTNTGTMEASSGGTLQIQGTLDNTSGLITALNGGTVLLNGASISNGTLNATGTGVMEPNSSVDNFATLTNVTITGTGSYNVINNSYTTLIGTITNESTIEINSGGNVTDLELTGDVILQGGGTVATSNNSNNRIYSNGNTLTNVNNLIEGSGQLGVGQTTIINDAAGTISADQSNSLIVTPGAGGVSNLGTFRATNGATLTVNGDLAQDDATTLGTVTGGTYIANASSTITLGGAALPLTTIGTNAVVVLNGAGSVITSGATSIDTTLITNNGGLHVMGGRSYPVVNASTLAFTNNGLLQLGGFGASTPGNGTFTALSLLNSGTIEATGTGNVLTVTAGITDPAVSTIQVDANSSLDISGGGVNNATGQLTVNGTLTLGSNNMTVANDYSNANFGVGNSFNKHANISPATASTGPFHGAILAAGTPGTSITNQTVAFGNVHVSSSNSLSYTINNTGTNGPDVLFAIQPTANGGTISDATLTGAGVTSSNVGPIADGNNSGPLAVNWNPTTGGPVGGATQTVHIANNFDNIAESNVTITGTAYNLASVNTISPNPINLGNIHKGGTFGTSALSISNTGPAGSFTEGLNATASAPTGDASVTGSPITNLSVAGSPSTAISVGLGNANTNTAGLHSGTVPIAFASNGQGTSGLGTTPLPAAAQTITLQGSVWNLASAATIPDINFGSLHVGDSAVTMGVTIQNNAPASYSEKLDASFGTLSNTSGPASNNFTDNSGSVSLLAPGAAADTTSMTVTFNPVNAGTNVGTVVIHLTSDGQGPGTTGNSGLGTTSLSDQTINLNGVATTATVYRLAQANTLTTPINLGNIRVGGSFGTSALSIQNVATNNGFSEGLDAAAGGTTPDATTNGGSITNLLTSDPANTTAISVGFGAANTSVAGAKTGTATITFTSDGSTTSGLGLTPLPSQTLTINGAVYREATVNTLSTPINLGIIHVGQSFSTAAVGITNTATNADSYSEGLDAAVTGTTPDATSSGSVSNLPAGSSSTSLNQITVGLGTADTTTAGAKTGTVTIGFSSDGATTSGLAPIALTGPTASQTVTVNGQVNAYAQPAFHKASGGGTLSNDGTVAVSYELDFGTQSANASGSATLSLENLLVASNSSFQDSLAGNLTILSGAGEFALSNVPAVQDTNPIAAGSSLDGFGVSFSNLGPGTYDEVLTLSPISTNASGDSPLDDVTLDLHLVVTGVSPVPEPTTLGVLALGGVGLLLRKRRR